MRLDHLTVAELDALIARAQQTRTHRRALEELKAQGWRYVNEGGAPHRVLEESADLLGLDAGLVVAGADATLPQRPEGEEWSAPTHAGDAYRADAVVTHEGKTWRSLIPFNVWEPGVSGWREVVTDDDGNPTDEPPEYVPPTGQHDAYHTGDRVTFEGQVYESTIDNNTWSPAEHPPAWKLIEGDN